MKLKKFTLVVILSIFILTIISGKCFMAQESKNKPSENSVIKLPEPRFDSETSVEKAMKNRKSRRNYIDSPLNLQEVSQILWSAQGITRQGFYRTVPSAGALYPLEIYVFVGNVTNLSNGIYKYKPQSNELLKVADGDKRYELSVSALDQDFLEKASIDLLFCAVYERVTGKYGKRGIMYVTMEAGHASQNVYLQAEALGLGTVAVGAFEEDKVKKIFKLEKDEEPIYIMPVGRVK